MPPDSRDCQWSHGGGSGQVANLLQQCLALAKNSSLKRTLFPFRLLSVSFKVTHKAMTGFWLDKGTYFGSNDQRRAINTI